MRHQGISITTVCGIEELEDQGDRGVTHVLSLLDPGWPAIDSFERFGPHERAIMHFHDTIAPQEGRVMPTAADMAAILRFGKALTASDGAGHLLVHCHMGVSRSTAALLAMMAQARPEDDAEALFADLRAIRPQAWPNSLMVRLADEALGRGGSLLDALCRHYALRLADEPRYVEWMTRLNRQRELEMAGLTRP